MANGVKLRDLTSDISLEIDRCFNSQSLITMTYSPSTEECVFSACVAHPGGLVQQALQELLDASIINIVILRHWVTAVR